MNIVKIAEQIAEQGHKGQFRRGGEPYISHPLAVRDIVKSWILDYFNWFDHAELMDYKSKNEIENLVFLCFGHNTDKIKRNKLIEIIEILAISHDLNEDTEISESKFIELLDKEANQYNLGLSKSEYLIIENCLYNLNKNNHQNYLGYILSIKNSYLALLVKLADISHNLSTIEKDRKSQIDKYKMAKYILLN